MTEVKPAVLKAIEEIQSCFPDCQVEIYPDGSGGAFVIIRGISLAPPYAQTDTWMGFQITFQYPYADVYPHFTRPDLSRKDGKPLGEGFGTPAQFRGQPAVQISRRSNKLNPATDTASLKLQKVLQWMKKRP
jgi:hypothetical protein